MFWVIILWEIFWFIFCHLWVFVLDRLTRVHLQYQSFVFSWVRVDYPFLLTRHKCIRSCGLPTSKLILFLVSSLLSSPSFILSCFKHFFFLKCHYGRSCWNEERNGTNARTNEGVNACNASTQLANISNNKNSRKWGCRNDWSSYNICTKWCFSSDCTTSYKQ